MASRWPFVGRRKELALAGSWIQAGDGVLLLGTAGVGKTALARTLAQRAADEGRPVHYVVGHAVSTESPYSALAGALGGLDVDGLSVHHARQLLLDELRGSGDVTPLLVLDDVQLVDEESARVVLDLAAGREAVVVATTQDAGASPVATRLWRDGHCERLELGGLPDGEITEFLESTLDGPVDAATVRLFAQRSQGNPLMLRELVGVARDTGSLVRRAAWTLVGEPPLSSGVRELVRDRLAGLTGPDREAMELLAATEPLPVAVALELVEEWVLDRLETDGLVLVRPSGDLPEVSTSHPLYGEVLRSVMPALRLRRARLEVASRLESDTAGRPSDVVRAALWRLDDGEALDPQRLLVAAKAARSFNLATAERLARAATTDGASLPAVLLLAEILTHRGRGTEASSLLATLPPDSLAADDREAIVYCAAVGQGLAVGDPGQGVAMVEGVIAGDPGATGQLRALHVSLLAFDAKFEDAYERGKPIVEDARGHPAVRTLASVGVVGASYWTGRFDRAIDHVDLLLPVAAQVLSEVPFGEPSLNVFAVSALLEKGDHVEAERRVLEMRRRAEDEEYPFALPRSEFLLGRIEQYRGQMTSAQRRFRRAVATLGPFDQFALRFIWSAVARAAALRGDLDEADEALRSGAGLVPMKPYETEWDLAEAAVLAARVRMDEAADRASWAASVAADWGQWNIAVAGYHDAARYGAARTALPAIRAIPALDGPLPACYLDHVAALAADDAEALDAVAARFEALGALPLAAEAADEAALAHGRAQEHRAALANGNHARAIRARCDSVTAPWLTGAASGVVLTARERQVAALAAEGLTDAAISEQLGISIRTAQTHLSRCYAKLGISRRSDLAGALTTS